MESLEEQKKLKEYEEPEELKKLGKYPHWSIREKKTPVPEELRLYVRLYMRPLKRLSLVDRP